MIQVGQFIRASLRLINTRLASSPDLFVWPNRHAAVHDPDARETRALQDSSGFIAAQGYFAERDDFLVFRQFTQPGAQGAQGNEDRADQMFLLMLGRAAHIQQEKISLASSWALTSMGVMPAIWPSSLLRATLAAVMILSSAGE